MFEGMPALARDKRTKTVELCHAFEDETWLDIFDRPKKGESCLCELTTVLQAGQHSVRDEIDSSVSGFDDNYKRLILFLRNYRGCSRMCRSSSATRSSKRFITSSSLSCISGDDGGPIIGDMEAPDAGDGLSGRAASE